MNRIAGRAELRGLPQFEALPPAALAALEARAAAYSLAAGEFLYQQGELATSLYVVLHGGVRLVEATREGQAVHLKVYSRGELFGVMAVHSAFPHHSGAQAIGETTVAAIDGPAVRELIASHGAIALLVIDHIVTHMQTAHGRIRELAVERVERRLARALVHYAGKFGSKTGQVISIDVPVTQRDFADFVGTTPETVNRILKIWEGQQVIRCSRQHIDILNLAALQESSDDVLYMGQPV